LAGKEETSDTYSETRGTGKKLRRSHASKRLDENTVFDKPYRGTQVQPLREGEARIVQYAVAHNNIARNNKKLKLTTLEPRIRALKRINQAVNLLNWKASILDHEFVAGWLEDSTTVGLSGKKPSPNTKYKWLQDLNAFYGWAGIEWKPPRIKRERTLPYLPPLQSILFLIEWMIKLDFKIAVFLQLLKETAARAGEAWMLKWDDIDFKQRLITIAHPEKGSRPRTRGVSHRLIDMLNLLQRKGDGTYVFHREVSDPERYVGALDDFRRTYIRQRTLTAEKLQNPRIKQITFKTLRHFKATMEYHKTKDILHVMQLLGHKSIRNTLVYTHLVNFELDEWICKVATTKLERINLIQSGFTFVPKKETNGTFGSENEVTSMPKESNDYVCKIAKTVEGAKQLLEEGFDYVTEIEGMKLFRKQK
jgi:integrase